MGRRGRRFLVVLATAMAVFAVVGGGVRDLGAEAQEDPLRPVVHAGPGGRVVLPGPWVLRGDRFDKGALKGWQTGSFEGREVAVPNAANGRLSTGEKGLTKFRGTVAWYRTQFTVPADGEYVLRFESVHHKATVWVDGREVKRHTGVYLPFEVRVPLRTGEPHTLVVRADYRGPTAQKRAGWHRTWFNFGGINREVTLRPATPSDLDVPTIKTRLGDGAAQVDATVHVTNRAAEARELQPVGALVREGRRHELRFPKLLVDAGETRVFSATVRVPDPALWSPESPNLYDVELDIPGESTYRLRTGLRQLTWRGSRLFLNGRRLELHGASLHEDVRDKGDALTAEDMDAIVASLKALGANATRSQHQLNPALLERLDAAGIVLWQGIGPVDAPGAWTNRSPAQQRSARRRARISYFQTQPHPSVIAWNLANEVAGNGHPSGQADYIDDMARELHRRDPGRLIAVDVWGAHPPKPGRLGKLYRNVDAIAVTNYVGWYENPLDPRRVIKRLIRKRTSEFMRTFRGKIVIISEFGAEANDMNDRTRPGGYEYQQWFLREHIRAYREQQRLSGMLLWNLRDFAVSPAFAGGSINRVVPGIRLVRGVNQKGVFDYDGKAKPSVATVREQYGTMGFGLSPAP